MRSHIKFLGVALVTGAAVSVFAATLVHAVWYAPQPDEAPPEAAASASSSAPVVVAASQYPERLLIPSLNIDANVQHVGVTPSGSMGVPDNFTDVAWYKYGVVPGQQGSAIMDGHVDNGLALAGVFKHLSDIKPGDDVYVETKGGARLHFIVTDVESYPYHAVPMTHLFNMSNTPRLDLITCDGGWVAGQRTYDHRLVVFTKLAGIRSN